MSKDPIPQSEQLGSDRHTMDWPMPIGAIQRMSLASFNFYVVYKAIAVVLLAGLLHRIIFKPKKQKTFPTWAAIEIALTVYITSKGGLIQWI